MLSSSENIWTHLAGSLRCPSPGYCPWSDTWYDPSFNLKDFFCKYQFLDSDMAGQVIFVDPMSKRIPIWWTAIILDPRRDVPSYVLKNAKPGEVFIRYFADGS